MGLTVKAAPLTLHRGRGKLGQSAAGAQVPGLLIGCVFAGGCIVSKVDAYAGPQVQPQLIYQVAPATDQGWRDLQFQEIAGEVRNALRLSGFKVAASPQDVPDVVVIAEYGVSEPRTISTTRTGSSSQYVPPRTVTVTPKYDAGHPVQVEVKGGFQDVPTTMTTTTTVYHRHFKAVAIDYKVFKETKQLQEVWKVDVESGGESGDIREIMPALIAAAAPYFGKSTGKQVEVTMKKSAPEIVAVRTGEVPAKRR